MTDSVNNRSVSYNVKDSNSFINNELGTLNIYQDYFDSESGNIYVSDVVGSRKNVKRVSNNLMHQMCHGKHQKYLQNVKSENITTCEDLYSRNVFLENMFEKLTSQRRRLAKSFLKLERENRDLKMANLNTINKSKEMSEIIVMAKNIVYPNKDSKIFNVVKEPKPELKITSFGLSDIRDPNSLPLEFLKHLMANPGVIIIEEPDTTLRISSTSDFITCLKIISDFTVRRCENYVFVFNQREPLSTMVSSLGCLK